MSNFDFLQISRNFKSYYQTLRDVHYYLTNDSDLSEEELQAVSKVLSKLIYGFIRIKGTSFREMDREQFEQEFNLFHQDFLKVIQTSGENYVDFDQFTALIDEIIGIAVKRTNALGKIIRVKQQPLIEDDEMLEVTEDEAQLSNENEDVVADEEVVVEVIDVMDEIKEEVPEVRTHSTELKTFNTELKSFSTELKSFSTDDETLSTDGEILSTDVKTFSTDVETLSNEVEGVQDETGNAKNKKPQQEIEVVIADVVKEVKVAAVMPKKVKNNFVDAAPVVNTFTDYESSDDFRFRPRRRKNR
ncbi:hypothetical protein SAMN05444673_3785 [Bacillus sp. OV166]|uniref:hypothetical protein n=1 Tax=Bacillus sp. OV166 TaxID=1882763 RepID=UPI000A2ACC44|nr:hypothetical protein [Bacillus sp. OV166]SMQ79754.1 hypothetical protein SAMN05444673_3785 [Bacillus sp. OV166]